MRVDRSRVREGMTAVSTKGEPLGKVIRCDDRSFIVEKGRFFPQDFELRYEYVSDVQGDRLIYALDDRISNAAERSRPSAAEAQREGADAAAVAAGARPTARAHHEEESRRLAESRPSVGDGRPLVERGPLAESRAGETGVAVESRRLLGGGGAPSDAESSASPPKTRVREGQPLQGSRRAAERIEEQEEIRIPLLEEELSVETISRETGHVRIHKEVRVEHRHLTVPITREEVVVERLPATQGAGASGAEAPFKEQTIDLAVHEDEVRVTKHPVVREELRVRKLAHHEERDTDATLRREEADIEDTTRPSTRRSSGSQPMMAASGRDDDSTGRG